MGEGQVEQSGIDRSQNKIIDLAAERQKRTEGKMPPGQPTGKPGIEAGTLLSSPQTQERALVIDFEEARDRREDAWVYDLLKKRLPLIFSK